MPDLSLSPCPFCGTQDRVQVIVNTPFVGQRVKCCRCGAEGPVRVGAEAAAKAWNDRTTTEVVDAPRA